MDLKNNKKLRIEENGIISLYEEKSILSVISKYINDNWKMWSLFYTIMGAFIYIYKVTYYLYRYDINVINIDLRYSNFSGVIVISIVNKYFLFIILFPIFWFLIASVKEYACKIEKIIIVMGIFAGVNSLISLLIEMQRLNNYTLSRNSYIFSVCYFLFLFFTVPFFHRKLAYRYFNKFMNWTQYIEFKIIKLVERIKFEHIKIWIFKYIFRNRENDNFQKNIDDKFKCVISFLFSSVLSVIILSLLFLVILLICGYSYLDIFVWSYFNNYYFYTAISSFMLILMLMLENVKDEWKEINLKQQKEKLKEIPKSLGVLVIVTIFCIFILPLVFMNIFSSKNQDFKIIQYDINNELNTSEVVIYETPEIYVVRSYIYDMQDNSIYIIKDRDKIIDKSGITVINKNFDKFELFTSKELKNEFIVNKVIITKDDLLYEAVIKPLYYNKYFDANKFIWYYDGQEWNVYTDSLIEARLENKINIFNMQGECDEQMKSINCYMDFPSGCFKWVFSDENSKNYLLKNVVDDEDILINMIVKK